MTPGEARACSACLPAFGGPQPTAGRIVRQILAVTDAKVVCLVRAVGFSRVFQEHLAVGVGGKG